MAAPVKPNYDMAAVDTANANYDYADLTTNANRPTQITPYGEEVWTQGTDFDQAGFDQATTDYNNPNNTTNPANFDAEAYLSANPDVRASGMDPFQHWLDYGMEEERAYTGSTAAPTEADFTTNNTDWTMTQTMSPEQKALYDSQNTMDQGMSDMGVTALEGMQGMFDDPFNAQSYGPREQYQGPTDAMPTYGENRQSVQDAMMSRVNTDIGRDRASTEAQLIASGIPKGSEAFNREMESLDRKQTDARQQAEIASTEMAGMDYNQALAGRNQGIGEGYDTYNTSNQYMDARMNDDLLSNSTNLNNFNALRSGQQVQDPSFYTPGSMPAVSGPDYLTSTIAGGEWDLNKWNADQAGDNALRSDLFGLAGSAIQKDWG